MKFTLSARAGVASRMPAIATPVLYEQIRRRFLVSAATQLSRGAISDLESLALKPAPRIAEAEREKTPSRQAAQGPAVAEAFALGLGGTAQASSSPMFEI